MSWNPNETPISRITLAVMCIFSAIGAPVWHLFQFYPLIFKSYDFATLLVISSCIGFPLLLINSFGGMLAEQSDGTDPDDPFLSGFPLGSIITISVLYIPALGTYFWYVSSKASLIVSTTSEILFIAIFAIVGSRKTRQEKSSNNPAPPAGQTPPPPTP